MFHFIKTLERQVLIAVILVAVITVLTTRGFGGAARGAITAMAETPAVSYDKEKQGTEKETEVFAAGEEDILTPSRERIVPETDTLVNEDMEGADYGQKVVGYFLTQERKEQREQREAAGEPVSKEDSSKEDWPAESSSAEETLNGREGAEAVSLKGISLSREDYQVLLRIVEAEAGICDMKGKILVANVILNRVKSGEFPDTVTGVVYQPSQFSPVANGTINTCKVSSETVESVERALRGEDYSQGALFFMNRAAARSGSVSWFDGHLTYLFGHQGHEFFK